MKTKYFLIFFLSCTSFLSATADFQRPLPLSELISIALENTPETRQAWWNAKRAAAAVGSAESAYYPQVSFTGGISHGRDFKFLNGPDVNYTITDADLVLAMLLYDFGETRAAVDSAKMVLLAAQWQTNSAFQKVIARVLDHSYATLHAQEVLQAGMISLREAEKMLEIARELNRAGVTPISDVYTTQATLSQMEMEVAQQKANLDIQKGKLATTLGFSAETAIEVAPIGTLPPIHKQHVARLIDLAYAQRADLMAKRARVCESFSRAEKARAEYYPKVAFTSFGGAEHALHDKSHGAHYNVALTVDIPIFNGFDTTYRNRAALADTQVTAEELAQLELDIAMEVLTHSRNLTAAQEMQAYAAANLDNAQKAYEAVLDKYRAGKERIAEVSFAQRQLATARVRSSDVKTRYLVSMANLAYATGSLNMEATCGTGY